MHQIETTYHGARLTLSFDDSPAAKLAINGLVREEASSNSDAITLRLSSTVQTDYEWHEFIEGTVRYSASRIEATLIANNTELLQQAFERERTA